MASAPENFDVEKRRKEIIKEKNLNEDQYKKHEVLCCQNLGDAYLQLSQYEKAIDCYNRGLDISLEINFLSGITSSYGKLGIVYCKLGQDEKGIEYLKKDIEISTKIGDPSGIASSNANLWVAYCSLGQDEKGIEFFEKDLKLSIANEDQSGIASTCVNLGNAYRKLEQYEKSIEYYERGLESSIAIKDRSEMARNYANLALSYRVLGEFQKSISCSMKGLKVCDETCDPSIPNSLHGSLGITYFFQARSKLDKSEAFNICQKAISCLIKSVQCSDQIFLTLDVDQNKISFAKKYFERYVILMRCFLFVERIEAALLVIDLGKAKALHSFQEKLKMSNTDAGIGLTWKMIDNNVEKVRTEKIQETLKLKSNSSVLLYAFDDKFLTIWVATSEDGVKTFKHNLLSEKQIDNFFSFLLSNFKVNLNRDSSFDIPNSGFMTDYQTVVPSKMNKNPIKRKSANVTKQVETPVLGKCETTSSIPFPNLLSDKSKFSDNTSAEVDLDKEKVLRTLYQALIDPVKELIKGTKIIIVPDKYLFFVPFCSLLDENGFRLSKNYSVQITPSLHTLESSMTRSHKPCIGFALFVGNPTVGKVSFHGYEIQLSMLPSASEEVQYLARLFKAQPLVEGEATKERVLKFIGAASIIHFAAHGEEDSGEIFLASNHNTPELSSSLPNENSYLLKQRDIMKISINARLVVLSCCYTGKGKISSEGIIGLARAFLCAGARSVLATLWAIDDEGTKEFMKIFYNEVCNETSVCEALRKAMKKFQEHDNEEFRSFKIWAPFTIYGEDVSFTRDDIEEIKRKSREIDFLL